jgi:hypothetical protein
MPKVSVYEYYDFSIMEYYIRSAWKTFIVS